MNELKIMNIGGVDCYEKDGTAYLKLETVARGLGFTQKKNGVEYVKWERVNGYLSDLGFSPEVGKPDFIPENIFYRLAMKAKNSVAEAFQAKVADEIIPSIRKHGAYMTPETLETAILNPDVMISICSELKKEQEQRKKLQAKVELDAPKVKFAESIVANGSTITIQDFAKILSQNGCCIGRNKLYDYLIQNEYLCKRSDGGGKIPTQKAVKLKIFEVTEKPWGNSYRCGISVTSRLTPKGQKYFLDRKDEIKKFVNESKQATDQRVLDIAEYM